MAGYRNRFIRLEFPEISENGDLVWVDIKNPRLVPPATFSIARSDVADDDGDDEKAVRAAGAIFARLIRAWHVYDATADTDDQPELPLPSQDPTVMDRLPAEIVLRLGEEVSAANNPR